LKDFRVTSLFILTAIIFALLAVVLFGRSTYDIEGATVEVSVAPALKGSTELILPPLGTISAKTHKAPVKARAKIEQVSIESVEKLANTSISKKEIFSRSEIQAKEALKYFLIKIFFLAIVGGALAGLIIRPRSIYRVVAGGLCGALIIGSMALATATTYNYREFRQPKYTGLLTAAPWLMNNIEEKLDTLDSFRQEVKKLAANLHYFYSRVEGMDSDGLKKDESIKVLHVSDIHNNPVGLELTKQIAEDFNVDLIIDTGDITDFGTPMEASLLNNIRGLETPYVYIPGNHDSPEIVSMLDGIENVDVLEKGEIFSFKELDILGYPDPSSITKDVRKSQSKNLADISATELQEIVGGSKNKPDIVATHEPRNAKKILGMVDVVLSGHSHRAKLDKVKGTNLINAGTTGAAGIRTFEVEEGLPYSLQLLYFKKDNQKLVAVDSITIKGVQQEFTLERSYFGNKPEATN